MIVTLCRAAGSNDQFYTEEEYNVARFSSSLEDPRRSRLPISSLELLHSTGGTSTHPPASSTHPPPSSTHPPPSSTHPSASSIRLPASSSVRQQQPFHRSVEVQRHSQREGGHDGSNEGHTRKRPAHLSVSDRVFTSVTKKLCTEHTSPSLATAETRTAGFPSVSKGESTACGSTITGSSHTAQYAVGNSSPTTDVANDTSCRWPDDSQLPEAQPTQTADIDYDKIFALPPPHIPPKYKQGSWMPHGGKRKRTAHADTDEIHMVRELAPTFREYANTSRRNMREQELERKSTLFVGSYRHCQVTARHNKHLKPRDSDLVGSIMDKMRR